MHLVAYICLSIYVAHCLFGLSQLDHRSNGKLTHGQMGGQTDASKNIISRLRYALQYKLYLQNDSIPYDIALHHP